MTSLDTHSEARSTWEPLLSGELAERACESADHVIELLRKDEATETGASLSGGAAGRAVAFAHFGRALGRPDLTRYAAQKLTTAEEFVADHPLGPGLFSGVAGVAWAGGFAARTGAAEPSDTEELDQLFLEAVSTGGLDHNYDLISGLVGVGIYALDRKTSAGEELAGQIVDRLDSLSVATETGATWFTPASHLPPHQAEIAPNGYYNLGLAHGVPGIIGFLARCVSEGVATSAASDLLERSVSWLLSERRPLADGMSFPSWNAPGAGAEKRSRIAWCYGDLGLSVTLWMAGEAAERPDWRETALSLATACARVPRERSGCVDHGLCHGSAGNAHVFARLAQATGSDELAAASRGWFAHLLDSRLRDIGIGGYAAARMDGDGSREYEAHDGLLEGALGVALALVAGATSHEPAWDSHLLLSASHNR